MYEREQGSQVLIASQELRDVMSEARRLLPGGRWFTRPDEGSFIYAEVPPPCIQPFQRLMDREFAAVRLAWLIATALTQRRLILLPGRRFPPASLSSLRERRISAQASQCSSQLPSMEILLPMDSKIWSGTGQNCCIWMERFLLL